ncbi:aminopeptidase I zinc metalloprotease [Teladorsagia circumcincta]|uniref:Aspartyl aminopeptidase n=1 Tax=Teladorsagia circumcincta TaxID=45464 RepID=A0A2G9UMM4_TELCI|nr:aminopeptidase I zinc metalloprotease [Teladorsagia circumcincta]
MSYELASDGNYIGKGKTVPMAVQECKERLLQAGFEELSETARWEIKPMGKYFVTKNRSAIIAFAVGGSYVPGNGFAIVVAHTDSPCLRVKPVSKVQSEKFNQIQSDAQKDPRDITADHHANFLDLVAVSAHTTADQVVDLDLYLYDSNPARIGGIHDEFITGARLDNLVGTYTAMQGLLESLTDDRLLLDDINIRMAAAFDNEEVGSQTAMGAQSSFTEYVLRRLAAGGEACAFEEAIGRSILVSADQAHAAHPNYSDQHEVD